MKIVKSRYHVDQLSDVLLRAKEAVAKYEEKESKSDTRKMLLFEVLPIASMVTGGVVGKAIGNMTLTAICLCLFPIYMIGWLVVYLRNNKKWVAEYTSDIVDSPDEKLSGADIKQKLEWYIYELELCAEEIEEGNKILDSVKGYSESELSLCDSNIVVTSSITNSVVKVISLTSLLDLNEDVVKKNGEVLDLSVHDKYIGECIDFAEDYIRQSSCLK